MFRKNLEIPFCPSSLLRFFGGAMLMMILLNAVRLSVMMGHHLRTRNTAFSFILFLFIYFFNFFKIVKLFYFFWPVVGLAGALVGLAARQA